MTSLLQPVLSDILFELFDLLSKSLINLRRLSRDCMDVIDGILRQRFLRVVQDPSRKLVFDSQRPLDYRRGCTEFLEFSEFIKGPLDIKGGNSSFELHTIFDSPLWIWWRTGFGWRTVFVGLHSFSPNFSEARSCVGQRKFFHSSHRSLFIPTSTSRHNTVSKNGPENHELPRLSLSYKLASGTSEVCRNCFHDGSERQLLSPSRTSDCAIVGAQIRVRKLSESTTSVSEKCQFQYISVQIDIGKLMAGLEDLLEKESESRWRVVWLGC